MFSVPFMAVGSRGALEPDRTGCTSNGYSFKGTYVRGLGILNKELPDRPYSAHLDRQAATLYENQRSARRYVTTTSLRPKHPTECERTRI